MKRNILSYSAPQIDIFEVVAERGYSESAVLPNFGSEQDEFVY